MVVDAIGASDGLMAAVRQRRRACCASPTARASSATGWPRRRELLEGGPIDVLTGDYLAELTMLILWKSRQRDPALGYARTFYRQMEEVLGTCVDRGVKVVANAGGLNPAGLAERLRELAAKLGIDANVAHVEGDDILGRSASLQAGGRPPGPSRHRAGPWPRPGATR